MKNNSVLFVSTTDLRKNTSSNIRSLALLKGLQKIGYRVDCAFIPSNNIIDEYLADGLYNSVEDVILLGNDMSAIKEGSKKNSVIYDKIKKFILIIYNKIAVFDVYSFKIHQAMKHINLLKDDYCIIISSSDPRSSHLLANKIIKKKNYSSFWLQYYGDPMTNDISDKKITNYIEGIYERRYISYSDCVLYTNPLCSSHIKNKYPKHSYKINWIPTSDICKRNKQQKEKFDICYIGDYNMNSRNIFPLYNICNKSKLITYIAGNTDIKLKNTKYIKISGRIERKEAVAIEENSKILTVIDNNKQGNYLQVPGKMYHYALSYKKILVITNNQELIDHYGNYNRYYFTANNEKAIEKAIKALLNDSNKCMPVEEFRCDKVAKKLVSICKLSGGI